MKYIRFIAALLLLAATPSSARFSHGVTVSQVFPSNNGGMLMGLGPQSYFTNGPAFLNWVQGTGGGGGGNQAYGLKLVAGGTLPLPTAITNGQMDATTGELIPGSGLSTILSISKAVFTPTSTAPIVPPLATSPWWNGLAMTITWTGTATVSLPGSATLGSGSTALSCAANSCTFTFGSNPNNAAFDFAVTNVNDPPKNIKVYPTKYATNVANGEHYSPDWLNAISPFGRLRTMDWMEANDSGPGDITQLADFNYQVCVACSFNGIAVGSAKIDNGSGGAGNTLTVISHISGGWAVGEIVSASGVTGSPVITAVGTGTGGNGTYTISGAAQLVAQRNMNGSAGAGTSYGSGSKGGVHPSMMVELSKLTGADIHFNLPANVSDTAFTAIATYFRDNMPAGHKVFYELCNENWNSGLGVCYYWLNVAAVPIFGGTTNGVPYAGYRMAQLMTIAQSVYGTNAYDSVRNPTGRWAGVVGGQMTTPPSIPPAFVTGFSQWRSTCSCSTLITDLFNEVVIAPYPSDFPNTTTITAVSTGATTTVTAANGFSAGQVKRLYFSVASGLSAYNNLNATIASANSTSFTFSTFATTGTFTNSGLNYVADGPLENMIDASAACFAASTATATGTLSGNALTLTGISGSVVQGEGVSGAGFPANTYINTGSAGSYTTNNSGTVGPVSVTINPCATKYQFFSQQWSKLMITGSNDFGYVGSSLISQTNFPTIFNTNALYANSIGMVLSEYEGGPQFVISGNYASPTVTTNPVLEYTLNSKWDAAGNDPLYTPSLVLKNQYQMLRNVHSAFSAQYIEQYNGGTFSALRYIGDSNPGWSAMLAENALGPYVDPTAPATWTASFPGTGTNKFFSASGGCSVSCTDTLAGAVIGTAATKVIVLVTDSGGSITSATCDGVTVSSPDVTSKTDASRTAAIYSIPVGAGSNTRTCSVTYATSSFSNRTFYVVTVNGLASPTPLATSTGSGTQAVNYTKGGLLVTVSACNGAYANTSGLTGSAGINAVTSTNFSDIDTVNGTAEIGGFNAPFTSAIFSVAPGCNNSGAAAVYR